MTPNPLVEVLLATHNGERFLREQIESILAQDYGAMRIVARDDTSTDGTAAILAEYAERHGDRFTLLADRQASGAAQWNFLRLMQASSAPYVAFADQDDVWLPGKISSSMRRMQSLQERFGAEVPLLVFSDLRVVDDALGTLHASYWAHEGIEPADISALPRMMLQNVVTGCTALLNRPLVELALRMPREAPMHDYWAALIASAMGHAEPLREVTVLYRQHGGNVVGATAGGKAPAEIAARVMQSSGRREQWRIQQRTIAAFLRVYCDEMPAARRAVLQAFLDCGAARNGVTRTRILLANGFLRRGWMRNLATIWELLRMPPADGSADASGLTGG